ncbi:MAG: 16S rRNA (guanine(527)-N(7))-methyltransferase RsmG [Deltaproteobacteria bacterium]|nr:16S rRNA (guanine(527)-N(7))-methyltransferase RsmG [Deltaproteobacteria bacterium]
MTTSIQHTYLNVLFAGASELGIAITEKQALSFRVYLDEIKSWGSALNLVHRADEREIILKDYIDSLSAMKFISMGASLLDLGSGAGFPGVPLKIVREDLKVALLEANQKKFYFLKNLIRTLRLHEIHAFWTEDKEKIRSLLLILHEIQAFWTEDKEKIRSHLLGKFDFVISRAFGSFIRIADEGLPFLKDGGMLLAMKGRKGKEEFDRSVPFLLEKGLHPAFQEEIKLPILNHSRIFIGLRK